MGLFDVLFGKEPSDSLPPWLKDIYANPSQDFLKYLQTGMIPPSTSTSGSSTSSTGYSNTRGTSTNQYINQPFITQDYAPLATLQRDTIYNRLQQGGLPEGYQNEGLRNIGQAGSIAAKSLEEALTSRGLGRATAAGQDQLAGNLAGAQSSFLNSLPMLARDNQTQDLGLAQGAIGQFGTGQTGRSLSTNNSTTNSRNQSDTSGFSTSPGGFDYGGYGSLLSSIMPYYQGGRQGGQFGNIASILASLFGGGFGK